ncbi:Type 1 glutamine amidotransferase-like domain-containing protein [Candidatus Woesearchaeota archaeon]|nr:Type 1 glutamine amidotransferase-like domain-containing protein [Candidatus Woesearchaeota archaeon]
MPKLILSGGTGKNNEAKLNSLFLKLAGKKQILYLPIARETKDYSECYDWISSVLPGKKISMLVDFKLQKIKLNDFGGIYIGGGNTFKLLKEIKENNFVNELKKFNGVIFGGSAGAIIFGKTIETSAWGSVKDENKVKLKDLKGLNLVNGYNIRAHYLKKEKNETSKFVKKTKTPIIALPEDSGVYINNENVVPVNNVYIFK